MPATTGGSSSNNTLIIYITITIVAIIIIIWGIYMLNRTETHKTYTIKEMVSDKDAVIKPYSD